MYPKMISKSMLSSTITHSILEQKFLHVNQKIYPIWFTYLWRARRLPAANFRQSDLYYKGILVHQ